MIVLLAIVLPLVLAAGAAFLAAALTMARRERLERERRVGLVFAGAGDAISPAAVTSAQPSMVDEKVRRFFAAGHKQRWGMRSGAAKLIALGATAALLVFGLAAVWLNVAPWLAVLAGLASGFLLPRALLLREQKARERDFIEMFPDTVDAIGRMLRAGLPITQAVRAVSTDSPQPVRDVFATIADQIEIGASLEDALDAASRAVSLADFRFFVVAVALQHSTGGNLASTLEILSEIVRKRRAMRMKAHSTTAEIRMSAYVLAAIPFLVVGVLMVFQPGYLAPLFKDPRGQVMLGIALSGLLLAGFSVRQMMRSVSAE